MNSTRLSILYRGPLSSCNYGCEYCPFAKHSETRSELAEDREALDRFITWVAGHPGYSIGVLFTPWGEALIRRWYQDGLARLTHLPNVWRAAIQTNLSCSLRWTDDCRKDRLALWATYHPTQVDRSRFLRKCLELDRRGVRFSVGVVGMKEHLPEIEALRQELPAHIYLWVNANKRVLDYYTDSEVRWLDSIDPLFSTNNRRHPSQGQSCRSGHSVISVSGDGTVRRCHFIREPIGNLYDPAFDSCLQERPCTNDTCGCHIGYVHLDHLRLYDTFGDGILERIPATSLLKQPTWPAAGCRP